MQTEFVGLDHPLLKLESVILTAHSAYYSEQSLFKYGRRPFEEIARVVRGEWPQWLINPEVKERFLSRWGRRQNAT